MGIGEVVIGALAGGGAAAARMEIARLTSSAIRLLNKRGRSARELAIVVDAMARSDEEIGDDLDRLSEDERTLAAQQLNEAATYTGDDPQEIAAASEYAALAEQVRVALSRGSSGVSVKVNKGQIIQNTGTGPVHAPFRVDGDYDVRAS